MKDKLDLIIGALEKYIAFTPSFYDLGKEALDAARELKANYFIAERLPEPSEDIDIDFFGEEEESLNTIVSPSTYPSMPEVTK